MRSNRWRLLTPVLALTFVPLGCFSEEQKDEKRTVAEKLERLEELLQAHPTTPEEFAKALADAVAASEDVIGDSEATQEQRELAYRPLLANLASGASENLPGFRAKLDKHAKGLREQDPDGDMTAFAHFFLVRLDRQDPQGAVAPDALEKTKKYVEQFPKQDELSTRLLFELANFAEQAADAKTALSSLDLLEKKFPNHPFSGTARGLRTRIEAVGKPFALEATMLNGKPLDSATLKDKVVIVDFWATWCGPCVAEIPKLKRLYDELHGKGLEIVGVSLDDSKEDVETFLETTEVPWIQTHEEARKGHPIADKYGIDAIPRMFLIGRDGKLISTNMRGESLETKVREIVGAGME